MSIKFAPAAVATACLTAVALPTQGAIVFSEDFEGAALGATSGNNVNLAGTSIQTANTAAAVVVDATTDMSAATAFTLASGNFARLSVGDNDFAALRPFGNANVTFAAVDASDIVTFTIDIYAPATLAEEAPLFQPRFGAGPHVIYDSSAVTAAGQQTITYTGSVADFGGDTGDTSFKPFFQIDQKVGAADGTTADFLYVDNISIDISPVPEPASLALLGLGATALVARRRRA